MREPAAHPPEYLLEHPPVHEPVAHPREHPLVRLPVRELAAHPPEHRADLVDAEDAVAALVWAAALPSSLPVDPTTTTGAWAV